MRNRYLRSIASFLIVLIISLPIYSSVVFAGLSAPTLKGAVNDINGYIEEGEEMIIGVTASLPGDSVITGNQLKIQETGTPFSTCSPYGGEYNCQMIMPSDTITQNPFPLRILLFNDAGVQQEFAPITGKKDIIGPRITQFTATPSIVGAGNVVFNYEIIDSIYSNSGNKGCVGIKNLVITSGTYNKVIPINSAPGTCIAQSSFSENVGTITQLNSGSITLRAVASDSFDQESGPVLLTLTIDKDAPGINGNSLRLYDSSGVITSISSPVTAKASVLVNDVSLNSVTGDFSSLKSSNGIKNATCSNGNCTWDNIEIDITSGGNKNIIITATDSLSNTQTETIPYNIEFDNTAPVVTSIRTNHRDTNTSYLGKNNNTIIVVINEAGVGFDNKNVYLDLNNVNGDNNAQANSCVEGSGIWTCYWYNIPVPTNEGTKQISIKSSSADDLGNAITGTLSANLVVDRTDPVIGTISYSPAAPKAGDTLIFLLDVQDANPVTARVNAAPISTTPIQQGTCVNGECTINTNNLITSYVSADVTIIAEDIAGNIGTKQRNVIIYQSDETTIPNLFSISNIELIPSKIDRKIISNIPTNIYVYINLQAAGSASIIGITPDCTEMAGYLSTIEPPYIMNEYTNNPYLVIKTDQNLASTLAGNLPIKCRLTLSVRDGQVVYSAPEEEVIDTELEVYGNSLGDINENIQSKIEEISQEIEDVQSNIDSYETWLSILGIWCKIAETMSHINSVIQNVKSVIYAFKAPAAVAAMAACKGPAIACATPCAYPPASTIAPIMASPAVSTIVALEPAACTVVCTKSLGLNVGACGCIATTTLAAASCVTWAGLQASWISTCMWGNWYHSMVENIFWPSGYSHPNIIGVISKYGCMIFYHCTLANWGSALVDLGISWGLGAIESGSRARANTWMESQINNEGEMAIAESMKNFEDKTTIKPVLDDNGKMVGGSYQKDSSTTVVFTLDKDGNVNSARPTGHGIADSEGIDKTEVQAYINSKLKAADWSGNAAGTAPTIVAAKKTSDNQFEVGTKVTTPPKDYTKQTLTNPSGEKWDVYKNDKGDWAMVDAEGNVKHTLSNPSGENKITQAAKTGTVPATKVDQGVDKLNELKAGKDQSKIDTFFKENLQISGLKTGPDNYWGRGRYTDLPTTCPIISEEQWMWNPYLSIHYAESTFCIPALVYNYKKDQQIKCLYRNCLQNHMSSGQSITNCELAYKERECLYVESAQYKLHGFSSIFDQLFEIIISRIPFIIRGIIFALTCPSYVVTGAYEECMKTYATGIAVAGAHPVWCGIKGTWNTLYELIYIFNGEYSFTNYDQELGGEDYCASETSIE